MLIAPTTRVPLPKGRKGRMQSTPLKGHFHILSHYKFNKFVSEREYENVRMGGLRGGAT